MSRSAYPVTNIAPSLCIHAAGRCENVSAPDWQRTPPATHTGELLRKDGKMLLVHVDTGAHNEFCRWWLWEKPSSQTDSVDRTWEGEFESWDEAVCEDLVARCVAWGEAMPVKKEKSSDLKTGATTKKKPA